MEHPFNVVLYGGDYNPEQWPKEIWKEDLRLFDLAGINSATVNVFSWAELQPSEEEYNFAELDEIIDMLSKANIQIVLATSTGAMPAWLVRKYPEVARVDYEGRRHKFGGRHNAQQPCLPALCPRTGAPAGGALRQQSSRGVLARKQRIRRSLLL